MSPPDTCLTPHAGLGGLWNSRAASHIAVGRRLLTSSVAGETSLHCVDESVVVFCGHAARLCFPACFVKSEHSCRLCHPSAGEGCGLRLQGVQVHVGSEVQLVDGL